MSKPRIIKSLGRAFSKEERERLAAEEEEKALIKWNEFTENFKKEFNVSIEPDIALGINGVNGITVIGKHIRLVSNRRFE